MNHINFHALLPTGSQHNPAFGLMNHMRPARNNMAVVEPVAVPIFPIEPANTDPSVEDSDDEEHAMLTDEDIGRHSSAKNDHSMMDDNISEPAEELERVTEPTDSVDEKAICPQMD